MAGLVACQHYLQKILTAAKTLVESYPNDLDIDELYHFAKLLIYLKTMSQERSALISTEQFLYKLISDKGVQDTFPNVAVTLRMYVAAMWSETIGLRTRPV